MERAIDGASDATPADAALAEAPLVDGRTCGTCNVCCVALTIRDPALQKPQGYRCRNARRDNSCTVYETRPDTCRTFFCGWRRLRWVREPLRPDLSGVLIRLHNEVSAETGAMRTGIVVTLLERAALKAEGLAETVAAGVAARLPIYLEVPGPPGHTSGMGRINEALADAVFAKDKPAVLGILTRARAMGRSGSHQPITFDERT